MGAGRQQLLGHGLPQQRQQPHQLGGLNGPCLGQLRAVPGCYSNVGRRATGASPWRAAPAWPGAAAWLGGRAEPKNLDSGKLLARRARHHASFGADTRWPAGRWAARCGPRASAGTTWATPGAWAAIPCQSVRQHPPGADWQVVARVDNLTDKGYAWPTLCHAGPQLLSA